MVLLGPAATAWAALIGGAIAAVPCFALWMAGAPLGTPWMVPARQAAIAWLVGHAVPVRIDDLTISLLPWGTLIVPALLLVHAGHWTARIARLRSLAGWLGLGAIAGVGYGAVLALAAVLVRSDEVVISAHRAAVTGLLLAVPCVLVGACRAPTMREELRRRVPEMLRAAFVGGAVAVLTLAVCGIALVAVSLIAHFANVLSTWQRLGPDLVGAAGLALLSLGYLPVLASWGLAYALGPGVMVMAPLSIFAAPEASRVSDLAIPQASTATALPAFPLLAAIPETAPPWAPMLPLLGVLAGVVAGVAILSRRHLTLAQRIAAAIVVGGIAGCAMFIASTLSHGSVGRLHLADLGPQPGAAAAATWLLVSIGAVLAVLAHRQAHASAREGASTSDDVEPVIGTDEGLMLERDPGRRGPTLKVPRPTGRHAGSRRFAERPTVVLDDEYDDGYDGEYDDEHGMNPSTHHRYRHTDRRDRERE